MCKMGITLGRIHDGVSSKNTYLTSSELLTIAVKGDEPILLKQKSFEVFNLALNEHKVISLNPMT
jgi:hypothetical protein